MDDRAEKLGYRIREAQLQKAPYILVLGKNEVADRTVTYRLHGQQATTTVSLEEFVEKLNDEIRTKAVTTK